MRLGAAADCRSAGGSRAGIGRSLAGRPEVTIVSRDRDGSYGKAATYAAPREMQIAYRWHLMEHASAAFPETVRRSIRLIHQVLESTVIDRRF